MKQDAISYLSTQTQELENLSKKIFDLSEESYKEYQSSESICDFLHQRGFNIERNFQNIKTAFKASFGSGHPTICVTCEYDAVIEKGHLTGHNINTLIHIACAISLAHILPKTNSSGTIIVLGCPGEYLGGSKEVMFRQNVFEDIDAILNIQSNTVTCEIESSASVIPLKINFKSDYALSQLEYNCNYTSLDASLMLFNIMKTLEKSINCNGSSIDFVMSESTKDPFIKANNSTIKLLIRAKNMEVAKNIEKKIKSTAHYVGSLLNIYTEISLYEPPSESLKSNKTLTRILSHNLKESGIIHISEKMKISDGISLGGISTKVPTVAHLICITSDEVKYGTTDFAKSTLKPSAIDIALKSAQALIKTAIDLLELPTLLIEAKNELKSNQSDLY